MAREVSRGDIWMYSFGAPDKRRPVVVISRHTAIIVPITHRGRARYRRWTRVGVLRKLANVQTVAKAKLTRYVGAVRAEKLAELCRALAIATGCE